ncbi:hypothetical protein [Paenochrobactrum sp. BZR 201-1]
MAYERGVRPDYTVGTITLVSGSKNFTTTGASLQSAAIQAGDMIITRSGLVLIIASVTGQNAGTLVENTPAGAAGANQPLLIRYQPDGSRYQGAARDLIARWGMSGNVDALAGLKTLKDTLAFFTGSGTADVTALTEWARTLLAAANGGKGYEALGVVPLNNMQHLFGQNGADGWVRLSTSYTGTGAEDGSSTIGIQGGGIFYFMRSGANVCAWDISGRQIVGIVPGERITEGKVNVNRVAHMHGANSDGWVRLGTHMSDSSIGGSIRLTGNETLSYTVDDVQKMYCNSTGNMGVTGSLSKGSGTFLIDHPLDPENKDLAHGFVEAPEYVNVYRGDVRLVRGRATVDLDKYFNMSTGTFGALNTDITVSSLQNQEGFSRLRPLKKIESGLLEIICEDEESTDLVSWMVTGRRKDNFVLHIDENCERETGKFIPEREKEDFDEVGL